MSLKKVINEAVDLSHLIYNGSRLGQPIHRWDLQRFSAHLRDCDESFIQLDTGVNLWRLCFVIFDTPFACLESGADLQLPR